MSYSCIDFFFIANLAVVRDGPSSQCFTGALFVAASLSIAFGLWSSACCLAGRLSPGAVAAYVLRSSAGRIGPVASAWAARGVCRRLRAAARRLDRLEWSLSLLRQSAPGRAPAPHGRACQGWRRCDSPWRLSSCALFGRACSSTCDGLGDARVEPGGCLLYTSPSPRDRQKSRMPSSA